MNGENQEFYAASVEEAVEKAARNLGVEPDQVEYSVLDEGSSGFLGIGTRDARISVTVPTASPQRFPETIEEPSPPPEDSTGHFEDPEPEEQPFPLVGDRDDTKTEDNIAVGPAQEAPEDLILAVDGFATEMLGKMGFDATVDAYDAGEVIKVDIAMEETGLLIGQKGETIDAVQYLLNVAVYKKRPFVKRITVDTQGYRQRRMEALQGMAHRAARRAQREKRSVDLPPMAAAERRVVHVYLKENPDVSTSSQGQEDNRRVVISPND